MTSRRAFEDGNELITPQVSLHEILEAANFDVPARWLPEISGADPVLPTRYRVGTAGAASAAAWGSAAEHLWWLRSGRHQRVMVDVKAAAVSLRSMDYLRINGERAPRDPSNLTGFYPIRDGWIYLHCAFPNLRDAALAVLAAVPDRAKVGEATCSWFGEKLEDAIHANGGCAAFVRSHEEWAEHSQAQATAQQPLIEITRIGDGPVQPLPRASRPLEQMRVLDLTRVLAGPTCARTLAAHGADVLKINAPHLPDLDGGAVDTSIGKLSAHLDLRDAHQTETLRSLVRGADIFSQSYRPGALDARGFSPRALAELRPGIVYVSLSAWGRSGPWRDRRGYDSVVQAASGMAHASSEDGKPRVLPVSAIDYASGNLMAFGAMVALARRAHEGGSWLVRIALARVGKWIVDRGTLPREVYAGVAKDLTDEELRPLLAEMDTPFGRIRYLQSTAILSETPAFWSRPPVPLGYHAPAWPPQGAVLGKS